MASATNSAYAQADDATGSDWGFNKGYCTIDLNRDGVLNEPDFIGTSNYRSTNWHFWNTDRDGSIPDMRVLDRQYDFTLEVIDNNLVAEHAAGTDVLTANWNVGGSDVITNTLSASAVGTPTLMTSLNPFDGLSPALPSGTNFDIDADATDGLTLARHANYTINIDDKCVVGSTRFQNLLTFTDGEWVAAGETLNSVSGETFTTVSSAVTDKFDPAALFPSQYDFTANEVRTGHYSSFSYNVSEADIAGFNFQGDTVINLTADVAGNVVFLETADDLNEFPETDGEAGDVVMVVNPGSTIYGDLVFGNRNISEVGSDNTNPDDASDDATTRREAAHTVSLTNHGVVRNIDFRNTANVTFVNTGTVSSQSGYGIDAQSIDVGISITNKSGGYISNINGSDTPIITINNENGGEINGVFLNSFDWAFDRTTNRDTDEFDAADPDAIIDIRTEIQNAGVLNRLTADRNGQLIFTNTSTGVMNSPTDTAIVLSGGASVTFNNAGRITASSSDTIDLRNYEGTMELTNTGTLSAATSNTIWADGSSGTYTFTNSGLITNTNSRAITVRNYSGSGDIVLNNSGTISSNQDTVSFAVVDVATNAIDPLEDSGVDVTVNNSGPISSSFGNPIDARNVNSFTFVNSAAISSNVSRTLELQAAETIDITNSSSITNSSVTAIMAASANNFTLRNTGSVTAFNRTLNINDLIDDLLISNSGTISNVKDLTQADSDDLNNYTIDVTPMSAADISDIEVINNTGGTISSTSDRALGIREFDANDTIEIINRGTIAAGRDNALDLTDSDNVTINNDGGTISATGDLAVNLSGAELISLTNGEGGRIAAGGDLAVNLDGLVGASAIVTNLGSITSAASGAIAGALTASVDYISITNRSSGTNTAVIASLGNTEADLSAASSTGTIFFTGAASISNVEVTNSGTILVGSVATDDAVEVEGDNAIRFNDIGAASVVITNSGEGKIVATGDRAIFITADTTNDLVRFTLRNEDTAAIQADNNVIVVGNAAANDDTDGTIVSIINEGSIQATASNADHLLKFTGISREFSLTNSGTIASAGDGAINVAFGVDAADDDDVVTFANQTGGIISSDNDTVVFTAVQDEVSFSNAGTIAATDGNTAVSFADIGGTGGDTHDVTFDNKAGGTISASGTGAVSLSDFDGDLDFDTRAGSTISAGDETVKLDPEDGDATVSFVNRGTISATDSDASHVLRFEDFKDTLKIENTSTGVISSAGSNAIYANHTDGTNVLDFDNAGTISAVSDYAVDLNGLDDAVDIRNSGTIRVTAGGNALVSAAGDDTYFVNSGTISARDANAVYFDNFVYVGDDDQRHFENTATGVMRASGQTFVAAAIGDSATNNRFTFKNAGTISATGGSHAVNMSGLMVDFTSTGTIIAAASPAIVLGASSVISISGNVSALGSNARAIDLEGVGSRITLADGARVLGDINPTRSTAITDPNDKHQIVLSDVTLASYYYEFDTDYFRFYINADEQIDGRGFSPALANYDAVPQMHVHHSRNSREIWRQFGRFEGGTSMRTFGFADDLSADENTDRAFDLSGSRSGFAHSVQQSIFDFFDAELVLVASDASYELDTDVFTFDQGYQAVGLGFGDLLSLGPFSLSAMGLTGLGENTVNRLVYTNTNDAGFFNLRTSYDVTYVDVVYEALLDFKLFGPDQGLTRRQPYRFDMEFGVGGSLHSETHDDYAENFSSTEAMSVDGFTINSNGLSARLKLEGFARTSYSARPLMMFLELEGATLSITDGTSFAYSLEGEDYSYNAAVDDVTTTSIALGAVFTIDDDMKFNVNYTSTKNDNDSDETSLKAAVKWRF